jgi:putative toxin-antitoxin system antitoxin component (TIGR02293 family)
MSPGDVVLETPKSELERVIECFNLEGAPQSLREISAQVARMNAERAIQGVLACGASNAMVYSLILPRRTLDHRRQKHQSLSDDEAERAVILVNTIALAERVFGQRDKAARWLNNPNPHFGGKPPIQLLRSALGAREIEEELTRIDEGFFG